MTFFKDRGQRPDLQAVSSNGSPEDDSLTDLERYRFIREQHLFLEELHHHGADLSSIRGFEAPFRTFKEIIACYEETLIRHRTTLANNEENKVIVERLSLFLKVFNACHELSAIDTELECTENYSELAEARKHQEQKAIIAAPLVGKKLKRALMLVLISSTPHIQGLETTNPKQIEAIMDVSDEGLPLEDEIVTAVTSIRRHSEELAEQLAPYEVCESAETTTDSQPQAGSVVLALRKTRRKHRPHAGGRAQLLQFPIQER